MRLSAKHSLFFLVTAISCCVCHEGLIRGPSNNIVTISPRQATVAPGQTVSLGAIVSGTNPGRSTGVTWSVQEASGGRVDSSGHYTAPLSTGAFHIVATNVADTSKVDSATVIVPGPSVTVLDFP